MRSIIVPLELTVRLVADAILIERLMVDQLLLRTCRPDSFAQPAIRLMSSPSAK
jgi:hypothetical protein